MEASLSGFLWVKISVYICFYQKETNYTLLLQKNDIQFHAHFLEHLWSKFIKLEDFLPFFEGLGSSSTLSDHALKKYK